MFSTLYQGNCAESSVDNELSISYACSNVSVYGVAYQVIMA